MAVNVTYRLSDDTAPVSTTVKGAPLTNAEIDGNFRSIKDGVELALDNAMPIANYTALRAYTGTATTVRITTPGLLVSFSAIAMWLLLTMVVL